MPELPEVQTVVDGIKPALIGQEIASIWVSAYRLRKPPQQDIASRINNKVSEVKRRAKYIIIRANVDLVIHLGMSGKLTIQPAQYLPVKHDHVIFSLSNGQKLVYNDPRRFGMVFWHQDADQYLQHYGVEPLSAAFTGEYLYQHTLNKTLSVKSLIMDQVCVVGVGNIYACEALFMSNILPMRQACSLSQTECTELADAIVSVLKKAIMQGGTTLKDYRAPDDTLGYFQQKLLVYGRAGLSCYNCDNDIHSTRQSGRSTFYCQACQA